ncbi:MAG: hypothetical protein LBM01_00275 [Christensenellaceae bacterium]|jgi:hypothetical protein|nr:hypothetical protein [Christensenellaceae bacterium]
MKKKNVILATAASAMLALAPMNADAQLPQGSQTSTDKPINEFIEKGYVEIGPNKYAIVNFVGEGEYFVDELHDKDKNGQNSEGDLRYTDHYSVGDVDAGLHASAVAQYFKDGGWKYIKEPEKYTVYSLDTKKGQFIYKMYEKLADFGRGPVDPENTKRILIEWGLVKPKAAQTLQAAETTLEAAADTIDTTDTIDATEAVESEAKTKLEAIEEILKQ